MMRPSWLLMIALVLWLVACTKSNPELAGDAEVPKGAKTVDAVKNAKTPALIPAPDLQPSEAVLRKLQFEQYDEIKKAGGLPLTVSASGVSFILHVKLISARKEKTCDPTPQAPKGWYECHMLLMSSWSTDGGTRYDEPSEKPARLGVKWDGVAGDWVRQ